MSVLLVIHTPNACSLSHALTGTYMYAGRPGDPDPEGLRMMAVQGALIEKPYIEALFLE